MSQNTEPGLLVPVWKDYQWIAPLTAEALDRFWPDHPRPHYVGIPEQMTPAGGECIPVGASVDRSNWTGVLREGVRELQRLGKETVYLITEEHIPLAPCHPEHLAVTLPKLMNSLPAVYIGLMGWDNRRFTSRSPVLDTAHFRLKHLCKPGDPRFHLHPALWKTSTLLACCDLALRDGSKNGSAWHFEKVNDRDVDNHPLEWRQACYQIHAASMRRKTPGIAARMRESLEYFVYQRLQGLYPHLPGAGFRKAYAEALGFDNAFSNGPYPLFFSGIMSKGGVNPWFRKFLMRHDPGLLAGILRRMPPKP